jgi:hypothetical protein
MASSPNDIGHHPTGADDAPVSAAGPADTTLTFRAVVPGALQYSELHPATATDYQFHAGSWLAGPDGFEYQADPLHEWELNAPEGWDPLNDPWPVAASAAPVAEIPTCAVVQVIGSRIRGGAHAGAAAVPAPAAPVEPADIEMVAAEPEPLDHACLQTQPVDLTEWPEWTETPVSPAAVPTEAVDMANLFAPEPWDHPSGPLPHMGDWPPAGAVPDSPEEMFSPVSAFDVTLSGPLGNVDLGFRAGHWYSLCGEQERRVSVGEAMWVHPQLAGQITQLACWWMRQNPMSERSLDLATELSMAVSEIARKTSHETV